MKISAEELGYLLAECFNAITPDTDSMRAKRWVGKLGPVVALMLRLDPEDVEWVMEILEDEVGTKGLATDEDEVSGKIDDTPSSEQDRLWAAAEFDELAQQGDDYAIPSDLDEVPDDARQDLALIDAGNYEIGPNEYDLPDDTEPSIVSEDKAWGADYKPGSQGGGGAVATRVPSVGTGAADPPASKESTPPKTEGFFCKLPGLGLNRASLKEIRKRASWVKSVACDSVENAGRMDLVSIFSDGTPNSSWSGYEDLVAQHRKLGGCFEEAMWIEKNQDDIPILQSMPEGIVIDFPGIRPRGTENEYGIVRLAREKDRRWKVGFVWIAVTDAHQRTDVFSDKIRLAVFAKKPETETRKK